MLKMADDNIDSSHPLSFVETQLCLPDGEAVFPDKKMTACYKFETTPRSLEKRTHRTLSLDIKMQVIKDSESGCSHKQLATKYGCGKTQIATILKQKAELLKEWEETGHKGRKRRRSEPYEEVNDMVWQWYQKAKVNQIPINGPILQAKAKEYAYLLEVPTFTASNGWLHSFRRRHNIAFRRSKNKNDDCDMDEIQNWKSSVASILNEYSPRDVYSFHETGLFFQSIPNEILVNKSKLSEGGNLASERLTVALCCNAVGEKETPLVISNRSMPLFLQGLEDSELGVKWHRDKRAWLTQNIFNEFLNHLNEKMKLECRKIVVFSYDVPCHIVADEFSNVLVKFLPSCSTTTALQPFDLGIIYSFKLSYRKKLLKMIVSRIGGSESINEISKQITVLQAMKWIASSWQAVKPEMITKCFKLSGIINDYRSSARDFTDYDPEFLSLCELAGISNIEINEDIQCFEHANTSCDEQYLQKLTTFPNKDGPPTSINDDHPTSDNDDSDEDKKEDICHVPFPLEKSLNLVTHLREILHKHCSKENRFRVLGAVDLIEEELEDIIVKKKLPRNS